MDVRGRLDKISKNKEGRGRLVDVVMGNGEAELRGLDKGKDAGDETEEGVAVKAATPNVRSVVEMDRRVGELEKLVGSSSTALDEVRLSLIIASE